MKNKIKTIWIKRARAAKVWRTYHFGAYPLREERIPNFSFNSIKNLA